MDDLILSILWGCKFESSNCRALNDMLQLGFGLTVKEKAGPTEVVHKRPPSGTDFYFHLCNHHDYRIHHTSSWPEMDIHQLWYWGGTGDTFIDLVPASGHPFGCF